MTIIDGQVHLNHLGIEVASHNWMGPDGHVVHYWVSAGRFMNVVCVTEHGDWTSEGWTEKGNVADTMARKCPRWSGVSRTKAAGSKVMVWAPPR